jgi:hypothetical protein
MSEERIPPRSSPFKMYRTTQIITDKDETAALIAQLVVQFSDDLQKVFIRNPGGDVQAAADFDIRDYFSLVSKIPYRRDPTKPKPREIIARPYYLLKYRRIGLDCKKKSILCGAWCRENRYPYRFIGSSQRKDKKIHHIFPQIFYNNKWENIDATYPEYQLFQPKTDLTKVEVLS